MEQGRIRWIVAGRRPIPRLVSAVLRAELAELINRVPTLQALREVNDQVLMLEGGLPMSSAVRSSEGLALVGHPVRTSTTLVLKQGWMRLAQRRKFAAPK